MNIHKIAIATTVVSLAIFTTNTKTASADKYNSAQVSNSSVIAQNLLIQSNTDLIIAKIDHRKLSSCRINQSSMSEDWINLFGRLIILVCFSSVGVMGNSILIERYIRLTLFYHFRERINSG